VGIGEDLRPHHILVEARISLLHLRVRLSAQNNQVTLHCGPVVNTSVNLEGREFTQLVKSTLANLCLE
jgi:hypothetical protein